MIARVVEKKKTTVAKWTVCFKKDKYFYNNLGTDYMNFTVPGCSNHRGKSVLSV